MRAVSLCAASALALALTSPVLAQQPSAGNLEKLGEFKTTGTPLDIPTIPQTGPKADAIKRNLASDQAAARLPASASTPSCRTPATWRSARRAS